MSTLKADSIQPTNSGNNLIFKTGAGDAERMRIDTSGFVGIGTTNPLTRLDIVNTINYQQAQIQFANTGSGGSAQIGHDLNGDMYLYEIVNGKNMRLGTNNTERLRITHDGKVGIANPSPAVALDVNGEARSSTSTTISSNAKTLTTKDYVDSLQPTGTRNILGCVMPLFAEGTGASTTAAIPEGTWFVFLLGDTTTNAVGCFAHAKVWTVPTGQYLRFRPNSRNTTANDTTSATQYQISTTSTTNSTAGTWTDLPAQLENNVDNLSAGTHVGSVMRSASESSRRIFGFCYRIG